MSENTINWFNNTPYSIEYNDIYFNTEDSALESDYVFAQGNQLPARFAALKNTMQNKFVCAETGFGTGLNFFVVANLWQKIAPPSAHLHLISVEKHPLALNEIQQTCALWPQFSALQQAFLAHYQNLKAGQNLWQIRPNITLELWIGDVLQTLPQWGLQADAWVLDGFAPAKNAAMWSDEVFAHMARLSQTGTTFSTFTSAGAVRRGLQAAGFNVEKRAGFGKKREMLCGAFR